MKRRSHAPCALRFHPCPTPVRAVLRGIQNDRRKFRAGVLWKFPDRSKRLGGYTSGHRAFARQVRLSPGRQSGGWLAEVVAEVEIFDQPGVCRPPPKEFPRQRA